MNDKQARRIRWVVFAFVGLVAAIIVLTLMNTPSPLAYNLSRAAALLGYVTMFLAILSYEYMKHMRRILGQPYLAIHHWLARIGLTLIVVHPLLMAWITRDPGQFVPRFDSLRLFFALGGRPALYLFLIAVTAGFLRNRIKDSWKFIHRLTYVAFFLAFSHSWLLGRNVSHGLLSVIWPFLALIVLFVFVHRHVLPARKRPA
jgi:DMSO/TMAO reductase YedYZ heme-binding membrane subunit